MAEENEPIEIAPKSNRILFCYFLVVLLLGLIAVGILFRTFDTAFVEKEKWEKVAESQKRPNRLCRRIFCRYVPEFEGERGGFAGRLSVT